MRKEAKPMALGNDTHMSVSDAAREVGVSVATIRRWIVRRVFVDVRRPSYRVILINREEVKIVKNKNYFESHASHAS